MLIFIIQNPKTPEEICIIYLKEIIAGTLLNELKNKGLVNSYEDDDTEETFFLTDEGKEHLKKMIVVKEDWTIENEGLTPTMKIKRPSIEKKYQANFELWYESPETTHYSIVDAAGNAVSITTTLNNSYGSKVFVGGAGFLLNDEMDDFILKANY